MASSMLISVFIVKIFLVFKCELSSANTLENADSSSNTAITLLYQIVHENKVLADKLDLLEEKIDSGFEALRSELATCKTEKPQSTSCSPPYRYSEHLKACWRLESKKRLNWFEARSQCQGEGGDLIITDTLQKVADIIVSLVGESIPGSLIYVGADDMAEAGRFRWVNGERVQRFSSVQSDKYIGNQHCLAIMKSNGVLRDVRCSTALLFLCQKN